MTSGQRKKPVVAASFEDDTGSRCVDIRVFEDGSYDWVECRRDPEDGHGWRHTGYGQSGFASEDAALGAAKAAIGWL